MPAIHRAKLTTASSTEDPDRALNVEAAGREGTAWLIFFDRLAMWPLP
jgi:hypothetical protein